MMLRGVTAVLVAVCLFGHAGQHQDAKAVERLRACCLWMDARCTVSGMGEGEHAESRSMLREVREKVLEDWNTLHAEAGTEPARRKAWIDIETNRAIASKVQTLSAALLPFLAEARYDADKREGILAELLSLGVGADRVLLAGSALGAQWLVDEVLERVDTGSRQADPYLLFCKLYADYDDSARETIQEISSREGGTADSILGRLLVDADRTGDTGAVRALHESLGVLTRAGFRRIVDENSLHVLEDLCLWMHRGRREQEMREFGAVDWEDWEVDRVVEGCHVWILELLAADRVQRYLERQRDREAVRHLPAVIALQRKVHQGAALHSADKKHLELASLLCSEETEADKVRAFLDENRGYIGRELLTWAAKSGRLETVTRCIRDIADAAVDTVLDGVFGYMVRNDELTQSVVDTLGAVGARIALRRVFATSRHLRAIADLVENSRDAEKVFCFVADASVVLSLCRALLWGLAQASLQSTGAVDDTACFDTLQAISTRMGLRKKYVEQMCSYEDISKLKRAVSMGYKPTHVEYNIACRHGQMEVVAYLQKEFGIAPDVHAANLACKGGSLELVRCLNREHGVVPNTDGANMACESGHLAIVEFLLQNRIRPSKVGTKKACENGHLDIVDLLLQNRIRPSKVGASRACENGHLDVVRLLLQNGINPGEDEVNRVCEDGLLDMVQLLLENDIRPSQGGVNRACKNGHLDVVELLVKNNIKPNEDIVKLGMQEWTHRHSAAST